MMHPILEQLLDQRQVVEVRLLTELSSEWAYWITHVSNWYDILLADTSNLAVRHYESNPKLFGLPVVIVHGSVNTPTRLLIDPMKAPIKPRL